MVAGVAMVKDEADIIEATVRRMARQVDSLIVADNASTDGTREILDRLAAELPLTVLDEPRVGYYQSERMTELAMLAAQQGATFVVPFDADEVWLPRRRGSIAHALRSLPDNVLTAEAVLFDHVSTSADSGDGPLARMGWRQATVCPLRKVAVRPVRGMTIHQGNHGATFDGVRYPPTVTNAIEIRHYPYRSPEQFVRKARNGAAAYAATDLPDGTGGHWREYGRILAEHGEPALHAHFYEHFHHGDPAGAAGLVFDPAP